MSKSLKRRYLSTTGEDHRTLLYGIFRKLSKRETQTTVGFAHRISGLQTRHHNQTVSPFPPKTLTLAAKVVLYCGTINALFNATQSKFVAKSFEKYTSIFFFLIAFMYACTKHPYFRGPKDA